MTITQAQKFVDQWKRILMPWHAHTEAEAVRDMERSCLGIVLGILVVVTCVPTLPPLLKGPATILALLVGCMALWLSIRLRRICRLFDAKGPQSFNDLKHDEFGK